MKKLHTITCIVALLLATVSAWAQSDMKEVASSWVLSPLNQTWTCAQTTPLSLPASRCHYAKPITGSFLSPQTIKVFKLNSSGVRVQKMYMYVYLGATQDTGPGSECPLDDVGLFELPWTAAGVRGNAGVIYHGQVRPCDGAHWANSNVFRDNSFNSLFMAAVRSPDEITFQDIYIGRSQSTMTQAGVVDDGINFNWSLLYHINVPGLNMPELHLQPHPSRPKEWFGVASINTDDQPAPSPTLAMTFVKVNWNNNTVSFQGEGTSWITIPIGGTLNTRPRIVLNLRPSGLSNVRGRYEVWASVLTSRSGKHPCDPNNITNPTIAPPPIYGTNTTPTSSDRQQLGNFARGFAGQDLVYLTITPDFVMGPVKNVSSDVRPMPSDHNMAMEYPHRADVPNGFGLYSGSLHQGICTHNLIDYAAWSTSGILFTNLMDLN